MAEIVDEQTQAVLATESTNAASPAEIQPVKLIQPSTSLSRASAPLTEPMNDGSPVARKKKPVSKNYSMDPILYMYTSLTAGNSHIITATSRMETILRANRIPFRALDLATDEKARMLWGRRAGKDAKGRPRKIPALVQQGLVVGDIVEVEEWNEYGELRQHVKIVAVPGQKVEIASKLNKDLNKENIKPGSTTTDKKKKNTLASSVTNVKNKIPADTAYKPASSNSVLKEQIFEADPQTMAMGTLADQVAAKAKEKERARIRENAANVRRSFLFTPSAKEGPLESLAALATSAQMQSPGSTSWNREPEGIMSIVGEISKAYSPGEKTTTPGCSITSALTPKAEQNAVWSVRDMTSMQSPRTGSWKSFEGDDVFSCKAASEETSVFQESRPSTASSAVDGFEESKSDVLARQDARAMEDHRSAQETRVKKESVMKEIEEKEAERKATARKLLLEQRAVKNASKKEGESRKEKLLGKTIAPIDLSVATAGSITATEQAQLMPVPEVAKNEKQGVSTGQSATESGESDVSSAKAVESLVNPIGQKVTIKQGVKEDSRNDSAERNPETVAESVSLPTEEKPAEETKATNTDTIETIEVEGDQKREQFVKDEHTAFQAAEDAVHEPEEDLSVTNINQAQEEQTHTSTKAIQEEENDKTVEGQVQPPQDQTEVEKVKAEAHSSSAGKGMTAIAEKKDNDRLVLEGKTKAHHDAEHKRQAEERKKKEETLKLAAERVAAEEAAAELAHQVETEKTAAALAKAEDEEKALKLSAEKVAEEEAAAETVRKLEAEKTAAALTKEKAKAEEETKRLLVEKEAAEKAAAEVARKIEAEKAAVALAKVKADAEKEAQKLLVEKAQAAKFAAEAEAKAKAAVKAKEEEEAEAQRVLAEKTEAAKVKAEAEAKAKALESARLAIIAAAEESKRIELEAKKAAQEEKEKEAEAEREKEARDAKALEDLAELEALEKQLAMLEMMNAEVEQAAGKAKGVRKVVGGGGGSSNDYDPFRPKSRD